MIAPYHPLFFGTAAPTWDIMILALVLAVAWRAK